MKLAPFMLALLLAGCAPAIRPGAPVLNRVDLPESLVKSDPAAKPAGEALPEKWWREFHDPDLDRLVDLALSGNPGLEEAGARLQLAQASVMRTASLNSVHADSVNRITRQRLSRNGNNDIYNGKTATIANIDPLVVRYHLDFWSRDDALIAASRAEESMIEAQYRQGALMLSSSVIRTYFAFNVARQMVSLQESIVGLLGEEETLGNAAYRSGIQPASPALAISAKLLAEKSALAALQQKTEALHFALLELLGKEPGDELEASANVEIPDRFSIPEKIGLDLVSQRPDIQAALWKIRRETHLEKAARAAYYPNLNLQALAGFNSIGLANLLGPGGATYAFGPALDLPLFEGGALEGRLHESEAAYDMAVQAYNRTLLAAARQIADALSSLKHARERLEDRAASLKLQASRKKIAEAGFRSGIAGRLPYLEAAIRTTREEMMHMEESLNWLNSITDTATALGGGFGRWPS